MEWTAADDVVCRQYAREAVRLWTVVVERTGSSRFDVVKAREQLRDAQQVLRRKESPMFYSQKELWSVTC
jgi:hypothetical protein